MTYNVTDRAWEISGVTLKSGELKFRANYAWDINWAEQQTTLHKVVLTLRLPKMVLMTSNFMHGLTDL